MATKDKNSLSQGRAIVTYGRSLMSLVIARSLNERGVEVIGCDDVAMTVLSFSRHVSSTFTHAPFSSEPEQALDDLERAVLEHAPDDDRPYVLIPAFRETPFLARHRDRFEPLIKVAAPAISSIDQVHPKDHLARLVEKTNLDAPHSWIITSESDLARAVESIEFPVIVKPSDGVGGRGVVRVADREALDSYVEEHGAGGVLLIQEAIDGEDYCFSAIATNGELQASVAYKNLATFPRTSGAGSVRETVESVPFLKTAKALLKATKWNGVAQLDFRWSGKEEDPPKLIEVNPRFWASLFHSVESGVDFPWLLYLNTIGRDIDQFTDEKVDIGLQTKTPGIWLLSTVQDVAESNTQFAAVRQAWEHAKTDLSGGAVLEAAHELLSASKMSANIADTLEDLQDEIWLLSDAPSELNSDDDPMVGLGALFVLSSLLKHGELPPEVKFEEDDEQEDLAKATPKGPSDKPLIGVTKSTRGDWLAFWAMRIAVWLAGGRSMKITAKAPRDPHIIDGLILGGGADIYPERYRGQLKANYGYDIERDELETSWAEAAAEHDIPVLGICRGAQMINVLAGGNLSVDLSSYTDRYRPNSVFHDAFYRIRITLEPGSRIAELTDTDQIAVNSIHSQAIAQLGEGLVASAHEDNGIVQAIENPDRSFWLGVQFHPEFLIHRRRFRDLFKGLVEAARARG